MRWSYPISPHYIRRIDTNGSVLIIPNLSSPCRDGIAFKEVRQAFDNEIAEHKDKMKTELGKKAIELLLTGKAKQRMYLHTQGLGGYEGPADTCKAGMVLAWEPKFAVGNQGFYLEDMVLVKQDGYEILTPGVPYTATDIEKAMKK